MTSSQGRLATCIDIDIHTSTTCGNIEWQMASSLDTTTTGVSKVAVASALAGARRGSGMVGGVVGDVQRAMFL